MNTATSKPKKARSSVEASPERQTEDVALAMDAQLDELRAAQRILEEIELAHRDIDLSRPAQLQLSPAQRHWFTRHMGTESVFEICRELLKARAIRQWREQLEALPDAKSALEAATAAHDSAVPGLEKQRAEIDAQIRELAAGKTAAQGEFDRLEHIRGRLRDSAPAAIREAVEAEVSRLQQGSALWQELSKVRSDAYSLVGDPLRTAELRELRAREARLWAEWRELVKPIEARIEQWVDGTFFV